MSNENPVMTFTEFTAIIQKGLLKAFQHTTFDVDGSKEKFELLVKSYEMNQVMRNSILDNIVNNLWNGQSIDLDSIFNLIHNDMYVTCLIESGADVVTTSDNDNFNVKAMREAHEKTHRDSQVDLSKFSQKKDDQ